MTAGPVDLDELRCRVASLGVTEIQPLSGGASSLTYVGIRAGRDGERVVIKMAPPGLAPVLHRDVLRQARLLRALSASAVPVPQVLWEDPGDPPAVPPLFVMSWVDGTAFEPLFDHQGDLSSGDQQVVADAMGNAARVMAALHRLDVDALGLADEPRVGPADEIERWSRLLETVDQSLVPSWADVADQLRRSVPEVRSWSIVHGDFRLGNMLAVGNRIEALIDWEIWSVGDPRVDVGWFLLNADPATYRRETRFAKHAPTIPELAGIYREAGGCDVADLNWFQSLASFKSAATWSLIVKHNRRRSSPDPDLEEMAGVLSHLLEHSAGLLGVGS